MINAIHQCHFCGSDLDVVYDIKYADWEDLDVRDPSWTYVEQDHHRIKWKSCPNCKVVYEAK